MRRNLPISMFFLFQNVTRKKKYVGTDIYGLPRKCELCINEGNNDKKTSGHGHRFPGEVVYHLKELFHSHAE